MQFLAPLVLGIDPHPSKDAAVWSEDGPQKLAPSKLHSFLRGEASGTRGIIVAWDAPLSFDPAQGFSDRPIDRAARAWVNQKKNEGRIEKGAVSVQTFSGCSHWALSCHVLGFPYGRKFKGFIRYSPDLALPGPGRGTVVEVHPAVALAALWMDLGIGDPFPRYKRGGATRCIPARIANSLNLPEESGQDDDTLDAFIAFWLGTKLLTGEAVFSGDLKSGGYLLPVGNSTTEVIDKLASIKRQGKRPTAKY